MSLDVFSKKTKVPTTALKPGHLVWITSEGIVDMGEVSLEDLKLMAYVSEQAKSRLSVRKNTASVRTLSRVEALAKRMYDKARLTK